MKSVFTIALIVTAALNAFAADTHDDKSLHGNWAMVNGEIGGQPMAEATAKTITMKLADGKYDVSVGGAPDKGTYEVDSSSKPKGMIIKGTEGPNKGRTIPAIYEVKEKILRICYDLSGARKPAEFKSLPGTRLYLATYQRKE
jgi:uncharacterized protein (TIGR03067 family)